MRVAWILAGLLSAIGGCGPCARQDDNRLEVYVDALIAESGSLSDEAGSALAARGRESIVILETGLYRAQPGGRRRIVQTLVEIGHPDVIPILSHVAEHDADEDVRASARRGLDKLTGSDGARGAGN